MGERDSEETRRVARLERELERAQATLKEQRAKIAELSRAPAPARTEGTRLVWSNLREWLDAWAELHRRRITGARIVAAKRHVEALTDATVEAASPADLDELERVLGAPNVTPPRGSRAGHATTRIKDAIDRARQRGGPLKRVLADELLDAAVAALRARPPAGVEPEYVEGFVQRNRGALVGLVRSAFS